MRSGTQKRYLKREVKKNIFVICMLLFPIAHFIVFWIYVNLNSILLAFKRLDPRTGGYSFSFQNFEGLITAFKYHELGDSFANTFLTFGFLLILLVWGFFLTYFLFKKIPLSSFWRTMLFVPSILPVVAMTSIFKYLIYPSGSPLSQVWEFLFSTGVPQFLAEDNLARWTILFYILWTNFGGQFIIFTGAMSRIPKEMIESAYLDGAGMWTEIFKIIFPLCWPTFSMLLLLNISGLFTASGPILLLTQGYARTMTISYWIFYNVNNSINLYEPAALGIVCTVILFPIVVLSRRSFNKIYADVEY